MSVNHSRITTNILDKKTIQIGKNADRKSEINKK